MSGSGSGYTLFESALGEMGLAWGPAGIRRVGLPRRKGARVPLRGELRAASGTTRPAPSPPGWVRRAVRAIRAHLAGRRADLAGIPLDLAGVPPFHRRVYEAARRVPSGRTVTYGGLARLAGASPAAARAVGQAMARNPFPLLVPCHRVLPAGGGLGGFSADGGVRTKARLLGIEGVAAGARLPFSLTAPMRRCAGATGRRARHRIPGTSRAFPHTRSRTSSNSKGGGLRGS